MTDSIIKLIVKKDASVQSGIKDLTKIKKLVDEINKKGIQLSKAKGTETAKLTTQITTQTKELQKQIRIKKKNSDLTDEELRDKLRIQEIDRARTREIRKQVKQQAGLTKKTNTWGNALGSHMFKFNALGNIAANIVSRISAGFSRMLRMGLDIFMDFETTMSRVKAITGATDEEFLKLEADAKRLGESTEKTASQVGQLQVEYAKLGFTTQEILNATEATLNLSTATGSDLAQAAQVAGATIRGFGLDASEAQRVTDVMTASFNSSALDLDKFSTAMSKVAPVAKAFGFSLEDSTALLAKLSDAGFDASTAATSTRNIILNLADSNGKLAKALGKPVKTLPQLVKGLKELDKRGVNLAETLELTDKRSVAAFQTFLNGADDLEIFSDALKDSAGEAQRTADIMRDNLKGDTDKAKSAIQGLVITLGEKLAPTMRKIVQSFTSLIGKTTTLSEKTEINRKRLNTLIITINDTAKSEADRLVILEEIRKISPKIADGIKKEGEQYIIATEALVEWNSQQLNRIVIQKQQEKVDKAGTIVKEHHLKAEEVLLKMQQVRANAILIISKKNINAGKLAQALLDGTITSETKYTDLIKKYGKDAAKIIEQSGLLIAQNQQDFVSAQTTSIKYLAQMVGLRREAIGFDDDFYELSSKYNLAITLRNNANIKVNNLEAEKLKLMKALGVEIINYTNNIDDNTEATEDNTKAIRNTTKTNIEYLQSIDAIKLSLEEVEEVTEALTEGILKLKEQYGEATAEISFWDDLKGEAQKHWRENKENAEFFTEALISEWEKELRAKKKLLAKETAAQEKALDRQEQRAMSGQENTLAFEKEALAKKEAERVKQEKKAEKQAKLKAWYNIVANSENMSEAFKKLAMMEVAAAMFEEGTVKGNVLDSLPKNGIFKGKSHKQGGIPIIVQGEEGIFTGKEMANFGKGNFLNLKNTLSEGKVDANLFEKQHALIPFAKVINPDGSSQIIAKLDTLEKTIKSKREYNINWDNEGNRIEEVKENNRTIINKYINSKPRI